MVKVGTSNSDRTISLKGCSAQLKIIIKISTWTPMDGELYRKRYKSYVIIHANVVGSQHDVMCRAKFAGKMIIW